MVEHLSLIIKSVFHLRYVSGNSKDKKNNESLVNKNWGKILKRSIHRDICIFGKNF